VKTSHLSSETATITQQFSREGVPLVYRKVSLLMSVSVLSSDVLFMKQGMTNIFFLLACSYFCLGISALY